MTAELPRAVIRATPDDFFVDELPAYGPSGEGEHVLVHLEKRSLTTDLAVARLARVLDVDPRRAGWAGMKDKHAVTRQWVSLAVPRAVDAKARLEAAPPEALQGVRVLDVARHGAKLKPGHLRGNRFVLVLRGLTGEGARVVGEALLALGRTGVPNYFGPQRFGASGEEALAFARGEPAPSGRRWPRGARELRMLFSAAQSELYNRVLRARERDGTHGRALPGDVVKKRDTGGLFVVPTEPSPERDDALARAEAGLLAVTGPIVGAKMRFAEGEPGRLERETLAEAGLDEARLRALSRFGEGTRRLFVLEVADVTVEPADGTVPGAPQAAPSAGLKVAFSLPKGGYATTVLERACNTVALTARPDHPYEGSAGAGAELGDELDDQPDD
jgi:tRNA pseudouridine13 synthase